MYYPVFLQFKVELNYDNFNTNFLSFVYTFLAPSLYKNISEKESIKIHKTAKTSFLLHCSNLHPANTEQLTDCSCGFVHPSFQVLKSTDKGHGHEAPVLPSSRPANDE